MSTKTKRFRWRSSYSGTCPGANAHHSAVAHLSNSWPPLPASKVQVSAFWLDCATVEWTESACCRVGGTGGELKGKRRVRQAGREVPGGGFETKLAPKSVQPQGWEGPNVLPSYWVKEICNPIPNGGAALLSMSSPVRLIDHCPLRAEWSPRD